MYKGNRLQRNANNLVKPDVSKNTYKNGYGILWETHDNKKYPVDLSHMAAPLGSYERSSILKELTKSLAVMPIEDYEKRRIVKELTTARATRPLVNYEKSKIIKGVKNILTERTSSVTGKDKFFYLNSYTGDYWTHMSKSDLRADKDAFILKYHPKYKGKLYSKSIIDYYSQDNLDEKRDKFFKEILEKQAEPGVTADEQLFLNNFFATASIGGLGLLMYFGIIKGTKQQKRK